MDVTVDNEFIRKTAQKYAGKDNWTALFKLYLHPDDVQFYKAKRLHMEIDEHIEDGYNLHRDVTDLELLKAFLLSS